MRKLLLILIVLFLQISCNNNYKLVTARLITNDGKDSVLQVIKVKEGKLLDLKFCLENYKYPPKLSNDIFWTKPDTTELPIEEKANLKYKYKFDKNGKVTMYFYLGSLVSGIFPLPYFFDYDRNNPELIDNVIDGFYKIKYKIKYSEVKNIQSIEKLDSLNKRIEILTLEIK